MWQLFPGKPNSNLHYFIHAFRRHWLHAKHVTLAYIRVGAFNILFPSSSCLHLMWSSNALTRGNHTSGLYMRNCFSGYTFNANQLTRERYSNLPAQANLPGTPIQQTAEPPRCMERVGNMLNLFVDVRFFKQCYNLTACGNLSWHPVDMHTVAREEKNRSERENPYTFKMVNYVHTNLPWCISLSFSVFHFLMATSTSTTIDTMTNTPTKAAAVPTPTAKPEEEEVLNWLLIAPVCLLCSFQVADLRLVLYWDLFATAGHTSFPFSCIRVNTHNQNHRLYPHTCCCLDSLKICSHQYPPHR